MGWDGFLYPWTFSVHDFEPITGRIHQPPPSHQTFQGRNFVICSFCPRKLDFDPLAVPIPYHHSNLQSEEMIYPLKLSKFAKKLDDGKYAYSWYENAQEGAAAEEGSVDGDASGAGLPRISRSLIAAGLAFVVALAVAGPTAADPSPQVTLAVDASKPRPDPEDTLNPLGRRSWDVDFHVTVSADRTCDRLSYTYRITDLFDGRLGLNRSSYTGHAETFERAQTAEFGPVQGTGDAADTIVFTATGLCSLGGGGAFRSQPVRLRVTIPPHSCDAGPLRVLRLSGHAWREDLNVLNKRVPLYTGHYVWDAYGAWLARRGRIVFGAPECAGFRISLRGGREFFPGSYERSRGDATGIGRGALARFVGDRHAGGISTENALVAPVGNRVATFEVYSYPQLMGRLTRVRVVGGAARVLGRAGSGAMSAPVLVRSGYVTTVRCTSYRQCRPDAPRYR